MSSHNERDTYSAIFAPFGATLKPCNNLYQVTAIRLRLPLPGSGSINKSTPTSVETASQILRDFIVKGLMELMPYLNHIPTIDLQQLDDKGNEIFLAAAKIERADAHGDSAESKSRRVEEKQPLQAHYHVQVGSGPASTRQVVTQVVDPTASSHTARRFGR